MYYATREDRNAPFSAPQLVEAANFNMTDPHLSPDGCELYYAADETMTSTLDLYVAAAQ